MMGEVAMDEQTVTGVSAAKVVEIARSWIGTPYCHQASVKGVGTDCLGLVRGLWRALYISEPELVPEYSATWSEATGEERLWHAARRHLIVQNCAGEPKPGEILLFRMRKSGVAKHFGIAACQGGCPSFIHAYSGHSVVESALSTPWRKRIVERFVFPQGV